MRYRTIFDMPGVIQTAAILPADPRLGYIAHKEEIDRAIQKVLSGGMYILGAEVAGFENEFAGYTGATGAVGVGNGTDAVMMALRAFDVGPGDAVITVSHTAVATVAAIESTGASAILVDVDSQTFTMNPHGFLAAVVAAAERGLRVKAVIPVHLYGHPADMVGILDIARLHGIVVIEDCAQAHGAAIASKKVGVFGDVGAFSFYPTKNLPAVGDGGAVVASDLSTLERLRLLRQYGWRERYISDIQGGNSRLDEIQAAVLRVRLQYLDVENQRRQEIASLYSRRLAGSGLMVPQSREGCTHVYHQYVVRTPHRDKLQDRLKKRQIGTAVVYPVPIHLQPAYKGRVMIGPGGLPVTERLCTEILSLPVYPELTDEQVESIIRVLLE